MTESCLMPEKSDYIFVCGIAYNLSKLAGDPVLRAELLDRTKRKRATRQYRHLVRSLAEHDAAGHDGVEPLILRRLEDCPERTGKQQLANARGKSKPGLWGGETARSSKEARSAVRRSSVTANVIWANLLFKQRFSA